PYVVVETDQGARRMFLKLPGQSNPLIMKIPAQTMSYFFESAMLVDKELFDGNLACYLDAADREVARVSRASLGCANFDACYDRPKTGDLSFCTHDRWRENAAQEIEILRTAESFLRKTDADG